jgi:hypothetical protein
MIHDVHNIEEPSAQPTVTIDGEEYSFEGLSVETQANIARVNELRREVSALQIQSERAPSPAANVHQGYL